MARACPILTPEQRKASEIMHQAKQALLQTVHAAVAEATERVREQLLAAGLDLSLGLQAPPQDYYRTVVHQKMYLALCGADPDSFEGGDTRKAIAIIRNEQSIAKTYWGAEIDILPPPGPPPEAKPAP